LKGLSRVVLAQVVVGSPVAEIMRAARAMNAQLLVIGADRRSNRGGRLFGKTGQLLRDARCPVRVVPAVVAMRTDTEHVHPLAA
jgi:nucleotide-binding universal stress UspA family protein